MHGLAWHNRVAPDFATLPSRCSKAHDIPLSSKLATNPKRVMGSHASKEVKAQATSTAAPPSPTKEPVASTLGSTMGSQWTTAEYQKLFKSYMTEESYTVDHIEGRIPSDLQGTFYRNGPGIMDFGGAKMHCFDGHGLIARVALDGAHNRAHFRSRYVQTPVYKEEVAANKVLYRGFGTQKPGGMLRNFMDIRDKPVANTSLVEWGGRLWALWEAHRPFLLDPNTLHTHGEDSLGGALAEEQPFSAHPCYDTVTRRLVSFGNGIRNGEGKLKIWEIEADCTIAKSRTINTGMLPILYLHDFKVTKNWYVFFQAPLGLNISNLVSYFIGSKDQTQQVFFDTSKAGKWYLVPRDGGDVVTVLTPPQFIWHYANAFEDDAGKIVVDACVFPEFDFASFDMAQPDSIPTAEVARFEIDPKRRLQQRSTLFSGGADFPRINPAMTASQDNRYIYLAAAEGEGTGFPFRRVVRVDIATKRSAIWTAPPGCFVGEPLFVPRAKPGSLLNGNGANNADALALYANGRDVSEQDDGYVLTLVSDGRKERCSVAILDARALEKGPLAWVHLKTLLPMAFHCAWSNLVTDAYFLD